MKCLSPLLFIGVVALAPQIQADTMYRTVDAQGQVTYSDRPLSSSSRRISVDVTGPNASEAARLSKEQAAQSAADQQLIQQSQHDAEEAKKAAAHDAAQQQRCNAARGRYATYAAGGRLFKADADGNRVYLSDEEIDQQRILAKAAVDSACNP
jgi:hypothetical protein